MADLIVFRAGVELVGMVPEYIDGHWFDRRDLPPAGRDWRGDVAMFIGIPGTVAVPSNDIEVDEDGQVAEVWNIVPV